MENTRLLDEVFVLTGYPKYTYVTREHIDLSMKSMLGDKGTHIFLVGNSKNGKSSLWKNYISKEDCIEIKINDSTTKESLYNDILNKVKAFYVVKNSEKQKQDNTLKANIKGGFPKIFETGVGSKKTQGDEREVVYQKIGQVEINVNTLVEYLGNENKRIILEDFHFAKDKLCEDLADDLKAFSDEKIQFIIVGVEDRLPILLKKRLDLQQRAKSLNVGYFEDIYLEKLIEKGCSKLKIEFSQEITNFIQQESDNKAYLTQAISKNICDIAGIENECNEIIKIDDLNIAKKACENIAYQYNSIYEPIVRVLGTRSHGNNQTNVYKWILKYLSSIKIGKIGVKQNQILSSLKQLGNLTIKQGSVNACVHRLPKILIDNNLINVFKYENKTLSINDELFQFYLRWSDELINEYIGDI